MLNNLNYAHVSNHPNTNHLRIPHKISTFASEMEEAEASSIVFCPQKNNGKDATPQTHQRMIDKQKLTAVIEQGIRDTDLFLVNLTIGTDNKITVQIDSDTNVDIDQCVHLSQLVEQNFNRDDEDYELEIGSVGLTSPLQLPRQYKKYIGEQVETLTADGRKITGQLTAADNQTVTITVNQKVKKQGAKRPVIEPQEIKLQYNEIKQTKYIIQF